MDREQKILEEKKRRLQVRAEIIGAIREFFAQRGFLEVETPFLISAPAPESHIDAIRAGDLYLHTSPELCMKRMLAAGYERIFQVCRCFRDKERGNLHLPEFTMLEWYRVGADYLDLMDDCEDMIPWISERVLGTKSVSRNGMTIDLSSPWERMSINEAFRRFVGIDPETAIAREVFEELMSFEVEPHLGNRRPVFLFDYPASLASLARLKSDTPDVAERCELYIGGLELSNGFSELTDPGEQKTRFKEETIRMVQMGKRPYPEPARFIDALGHMPQAAGMALGVDRLVMLLTGAERIDDVVAFTPELL